MDQVHHGAMVTEMPGGVNVVFGDGHVCFIGETIDGNTWRCLGAIQDGHKILGAY